MLYILAIVALVIAAVCLLFAAASLGDPEGRGGNLALGSLLGTLVFGIAFVVLLLAALYRSFGGALSG